MRPLQGALGSAPKKSTFQSFHKQLGGNLFAHGAGRNDAQVRVYTLDELFGGSTAERLGLVHLDVEGYEHAVLQGGGAVIARDKPLIVTEVTTHRKGGKPARLLLAQLDSLGYASWMIEELAGSRADTRNLLNVPRSLIPSLRGSNVLDLAIASRSLIAIDAATVGRHAFPCCAPGAECCPRTGRNRLVNSCCAHFRVNAWMNRVMRAGEVRTCNTHECMQAGTAGSRDSCQQLSSDSWHTFAARA
jgi:hypothetical protein